MPKWDIEPGGVRAVLGRVQGHAGELQAGLTSFGADLESAAAGSQSSVVAPAFADILAPSERRIARLAALIVGAEEGAAKATVAYLHADEAMAASAQSAALAVGRTPVGKSAAAMARLGMG